MGSGRDERLRVKAETARNRQSRLRRCNGETTHEPQEGRHRPRPRGGEENPGYEEERTPPGPIWVRLYESRTELSVIGIVGKGRGFSGSGVSASRGRCGLSLRGSILTERAHGPASFLLRGASRPRYRVRCQPEPIRPFACVRTTRVSCTHVVDVIPVPLKIDSTSRPCMGSPSMGVRRHVDQPSPCML